MTDRELALSILQCVRVKRRANKHNVLGRPNQRGELEHHCDRTFTIVDRANAARVFDSLVRRQLLMCDLGDVAAPDDWVELGPRGERALQSGQLDDLDVALSRIGPRLVELREGAWTAFDGGHSDSLSQAVHSAYELVSHVLRLGAPDDAVLSASWYTPGKSNSKIDRIQRAHLISELVHGEILGPQCVAIIAAADVLNGLKHTAGERTLERGRVKAALELTEAALRGLLLRSGDSWPD